MEENKYILVSPQAYAIFNRQIEHHNKWMVDLFTPKGLSILFGNQKAKG